MPILIRFAGCAGDAGEHGRHQTRGESQVCGPSGELHTFLPSFAPRRRGAPHSKVSGKRRSSGLPGGCAARASGLAGGRAGGSGAALCGLAVFWGFAKETGRIGGKGVASSAIALGLAASPTPEGLPDRVAGGLGPGRCATPGTPPAAFGSGSAGGLTASPAGGASCGAAEEAGVAIGAPTEGGEAVRSGLGLKASDGGGASAGVPSASPLADELAAGLAGGTSSNDAVPLRLAGGPPESAAFGRSGSAPSFRSGEPELLGPETVSSLGGGVAVGAPAGAMASGHLKRPGVKMSAKTAPTAAAANANIAAFSTRPRGRACVIASAGPGACGSTSAPAIVRPASSLVQTGAATSGLLESPAAGDAALPSYSLTYRTSSHGLTSGEESASKHSSN